MVQVKVYATLRAIAGEAVLPVVTGPGQTIRELVKEIVTRWPDLWPEMVDSEGNLLRQRVHIFLNGRNIIFLDAIETVIPEKANISIFPPVGGG